MLNYVENLGFDKRASVSVAKPLIVYEAVIRFGPISHDELYKRVGFSRSATFRALRHLESAGWIRRLVNNHQFVATSRVDELFAVGSTSLLEIDIVSAALTDVVRDPLFHFDIGFYTTKYTFCILESSAKKQVQNIVQYAYESPAALTAYCHFTSGDDWNERMLFNPEHIPDDFDRSKMKVNLVSCKSMLRKRNFFISMEEFSASICFRFPQGSVGCVTIRNRNSLNRKNIRGLMKKAKLVCEILEKKNLLAKF